MNLEALYILLPILCWPLSNVLLTKHARDVGSMNISFYRQFSIFLISLPFLSFVLEKQDIFVSQASNIFFASITGFAYLIINFYGNTFLPYVATRVVQETSRILLGIVLAVFFLGESISVYDIISIGVLFAGMYAFALVGLQNSHLKAKNIPLGLITSFCAGILLTLSLYFFNKYAHEFSGIEATFILEICNGIFISIWVALSSLALKKNYFKVSGKDFVFFLTVIGPLAIGASYGLARAYSALPFYFANTLFISMIVSGAILSYIVLGEKVDKKQALSLLVVMIGLALIVLL